MGIEPILQNSDLVAEIAIKALNDEDYSASNLANYDQLWSEKNLDQFNAIKKMNPKIWFAGDAVWDFIIEKDIGSLTAQQFYERVRYNKHLMPRWTSLLRWGQFRLNHLSDWTKYKNNIS